MKMVKLVLCGLTAVATMASAFVMAEGEGVRANVRPGVRQAAQRPAVREAVARPAVRQVPPERREQFKENHPNLPERRQEAAGKVVEGRTNRQAARIQHGIEKGFLTEDEVTKLKAQQTEIASFVETCKEDGKFTPAEFKQVQTMFNQASGAIFGEKHDTDGKQMPVLRLGKDVFLNDDIAKALTDGTIQKQDARAMAKDFHRIMELKRILSTADLTDAQRSDLQEEFATLLGKYFHKAE